MPRPPDGRTYHLWFADGERRRCVATFGSPAGGNRVRVMPPDGTAGARRLYMTAVAEGGSARPTLPRLVYAQL